MDIHEYQAKELLSEFGVPVPRGGLAYSPEQAAYRAREIGGERWVVKAQIHAGGRGKAGGIKLCRDEHQVWDAADELLGKRLVTHQTGPRGKVVYRLYVEAATEIAKEFYLGLVLDRKSERLMVVASSAGGMEIEDISRDKPETLIRLSVDPAVGMQPFQAREIAFDLGFEAKQVAKVVETLLGCYRAFRELDATMVEINPLVLTADGQLLALDAKMSFDDNALFRRPHISELRDKSPGGPARDPRHRPRPLLCRPRRQHRLHHQRRRPRHGDDGHDQACRRRARQLPRHRRRRHARARRQGLQPRAVGRARSRLSSSTSSPASIAATGWRRASCRRCRRSTMKVPLVVRLAGTHVEEGRRILAGQRPPDHRRRQPR